MPVHPKCSLPREEISRGLDAWYQRPLGQAVLARLRPPFRERTEASFGYHAVQIGNIPGSDQLRADSRIRHWVVADVGAPGNGLGTRVAAEALPFDESSVDLLMLFHTLEFNPHPHQALREAHRVLRPEGHLVVIGFNPLGIWGVTKWAVRRSHQPPWCGRFRAVPQLRDWLALLSMELRAVDYLFFLPPIPNQQTLARLSRLEAVGQRLWPWFGGVYMLSAVKRVIPLTLVRPHRTTLRPWGVPPVRPYGSGRVASANDADASARAHEP